MPPALPAAVLFDMDGTLIDTEPLWLESEDVVMARLGGDWGPADQAALVGGPLERCVAYMIDKSGGWHDHDEVMRLLLDTMENLLRSTPVVWQPGAKELLHDARRLELPTALVSASWVRLIDAVRDRIESDLGVRAFDVIVAGDDVTEGKPHPEPYLTAAAALGAHPENCLVLEDSPPGVASGVAAGCRVVAIPHVAAIKEVPALTVKTLEGWTIEGLWAASGP